jgi:hypothetical protein
MSAVMGGVFARLGQWKGAMELLRILYRQITMKARWGIKTCAHKITLGEPEWTIMGVFGSAQRPRIGAVPLTWAPYDGS